MKTYTVKQALNRSDSIERIKEIIESDHSYSRAYLARIVCDEFGLKDARGKPQESSCLVSLRELEKKGIIKLPKQQTAPAKKWSHRRLNQDVPEPQDIPGSVDQINKINLIVVESKNRPLMEIYTELLCSEHPLGNKRIVGRQLRYLIKSEHGFLGAISFSSCALYLEDRDKWIGWDKPSIFQNRDYVINMSRFLIRNSIKCKNLASFVLAKCVKKLPADYENQFGYCPLLIETFVDTEHYQGTCYKAANWVHVGQTKGRGRDDRNHNTEKSIKKIFMYPLVKNFRAKMGLSEQKIPELQAILPMDGIKNCQWSGLEFGQAELGDKRLVNRLTEIVENKSEHPGASYLQASNGDRYAIKGYYNFIGNDQHNLNFDSILESHKHRTKQRMKYADCVLSIQDTSDLNYSKLKHCEGLGSLGTNQNDVESMGLKLHSSFVVDTKGVPLGILDAKCYAPDPTKVKKKKSEKRNTPISEKTSYRWLEGYQACINASKLMPDTQIINVMDREADIYELFELAEKNKNCVDLLIRAKHNRKLESSEQKLFDELSQSRVHFKCEAIIPPQRERRNKRTGKIRPYRSGRKAVLTVRYKKIRLKPPPSTILKNRPLINLYAIYVQEENPPEGAEKISWLLITTLQVTSPEMAKRCIGFYKRRWRIEEWHRVLKTGLGIEKYKNRSADIIKRILAMDMVIGWRAMFLTLSGRENPGAPAELFFNEIECNILSEVIGKKKSISGKPFMPSLN